MLKVSDLPIFELLPTLKKPIKWAVLVALIVAAWTISWPDYYRSDARLLPVESKGAGGNLAGLASAAVAFGVSVPGGEGNDVNFVDILNSRWMKEQILSTEFKYSRRTWRFGVARAEKGTLIDVYRYANMDQAVKGISNVVSASRDLKSKIITISAETTSPDLSQLIVQRVEKLLEKFLQEKSHTRGGAKARYAEARLSEAYKELDEAEDVFKKFLENNRNYQNSLDPSVRLKGSRLENDFRLHQQLLSTIAMNKEQASLEEKNDIPILNILDTANLPIEKSKPARSSFVILSFVLAVAFIWVWINRVWVYGWIFDEAKL